MNYKLILEWAYRIIMVTILHSLIITIGFVGLGFSMEKLTEFNLMNWKVQAGLIQAALALAYLQIVNIFYWIMNINLFDVKKLFKDKKELKQYKK